MNTANHDGQRAKGIGINTRWFQNGLADVKVSQRRLAKMMGLDPSAVTLMLQGRRAMSAAEAAMIAKVLGVPVADVLRQAGIDGAGGRVAESNMGSFRPKGDGARVAVHPPVEKKTALPPEPGANMFTMPVPMSDGTTAQLVLPRELTKADAERIAAVVVALAKG